MIEIFYSQVVLAVSVLWVLARAICAAQKKRIDLKREVQLLFVYICLVVVVRFAFFPFGKVDGQIQPRVFDPGKIFPLWVNFKPLVYLFDYPTMKEALLNLIGNTAMFVPLGIVWPGVFQKLNTHKKVIVAGIGISLSIEILQLPFFGRATDIDDLILNTLGYLMGYGIYLLAGKLRKERK